MFLIVGLGNPGPEYANTRHNVGFMCVDFLARAHDIECSKPLGESLAGRGSVRGTDVTIIKPQTYMNGSGIAVREHAARLDLTPERILVVYDDVDLPLGRIRVRRGGGTGGHRGMESIAACIESTAFPRLRLGIGRPDEGEVAEYVLSPFAEGEAGILKEMLAAGVEAIETVLADGVDAAMNRFNAL